jgi:hypothetical protein
MDVDNEHYDPERSPVANLFDITRPDGKEHFLLPILLTFLGSSSSSSLEGGFVEVEKIYERLQGLGFTPDQIDQAILRGHRKKLIETSARTTPAAGGSMPRALRWTTVGAYHVMRLCRRFEYLDAVAVDTPIIDPIARGAVKDVRDIDLRLARGRVLLRYLDERWSALEGKGSMWDWKVVSSDAKASIEKIERRIQNVRTPEYVAGIDDIEAVDDR